MTRSTMSDSVILHWRGGKETYPYAQATGQFRRLFDAYGPDRFIWDTDVPNVERNLHPIAD